MRKFYVYVHRRMSDSKIFYVGKGTAKRDVSPYERSTWWHRIVEKHGVYVERVLDNASEYCCFSYERILISAIGRQNLCNLSDGGEGSSGHSMPLKAKQDLRKRMTGSSNFNWGISKSDEIKRKISEANLGRKDRLETRIRKSEARKGTLNPAYSNSVYIFTSKNGDTFEGTQYEFRKYSGIDQRQVSRLVGGIRKICHGWSVINV